MSTLPMKPKVTDAVWPSDPVAIDSIVGGKVDFAPARSNLTGPSNTSLTCSCDRSVETGISSGNSNT